MFAATCQVCGDDLEMPFRFEEDRTAWIAAHCASPDLWGRHHTTYTLFESDGWKQPRHNETQLILGSNF